MQLPLQRKLPRFEESKAAIHTLRDAIRHVSSRLHAGNVQLGQGTQSIHDEAVALVLWAVHLEPDTLDPYLNASLSHSEKELIVEMTRLRAIDRIPLPYITGEAWLAGLKFRSDARALIPRSPLAHLLLGQGDGHLPLAHPVERILDLCTGSGCLAIAAALAHPAAQVLATDLSAPALELARLNIADYQLQDRIELRQGDGLAAVRNEKFDLVICNPPYVNAGSMARLPLEFQREPAVALAGGIDGMGFIAKMLMELPEALSDNASLLMDIGHEADGFEAHFGDAFEWNYVEVPAGDRMVVLIEAQALRAWRNR
jgi:ribosomal protein L3 glutamine methyltransferase